MTRPATARDLSSHGRASIYDVARAAGVSVSTVSRYTTNRTAVADRTATRIRESIAQLGFRPSALARSLASRLKESVGLVMARESRPYADLFLSEILTGVTAEAGERGWSIHLTLVGPEHTASDAGAQHLKKLLARHADLVDGSLLLDNAADLSAIHSSFVRRSAEPHGPVVLVNRPDRVLPFVAVDNEFGGRLAARHLVELGHTRIACITAGGQVGEARFRGYRGELAEHRLEPVAVADCRFWQEIADEETTKILNRPHRPTALLVASDWMAVGVLRAIRAHGLEVPRDISIVGFDDAILSEVTAPHLTTVRQPLCSLGRAAFRLLHDHLTEISSAPRQVLLAPELIVRASTASPR